jgi:DNA ligase-1
MMLLKDLVEISKNVGSTTRKKEKVSVLARLLQQARGKEITLVGRYLSGQLTQGRLGVGRATSQEALKGISDQHRPLGLIEIDHVFEGVSMERGPGSSGRRIALLQNLFSFTSQDEREFLISLIMGEIRQGALEGLANL